MPFAIPMDWREQTDHSTDWYFGILTQIPGFSSRSKHSLKYPNKPSEIRPAHHDGILPVPKPVPENWDLEKSEESSNDDLPSCSR